MPVKKYIQIIIINLLTVVCIVIKITQTQGVIYFRKKIAFASFLAISLVTGVNF